MKPLPLLTLTLCAAFLLPVASTFGAVLRVDASAVGAGDGTTWADAYPRLQDALAASVAGDQIWIAMGVYYPDEGAGQLDNDRGSTFQLVDGVEIYGGFAGMENSIADRPAVPHLLPTVLSGDLEQNDLDADSNQVAETPAHIVGDNALHVVTGSGVSASTRLHDVIVTAGFADGGSLDSNGAGLLIVAGSPVIEECRFAGNQCLGRGGALYLTNASASAITNCAFVGNVASARGGAVGTTVGALPVFTNCAFWNNLSVRGGAANINASTVNFVNCSFSGNDATINGGAIQGNLSAALDFTNSILWNNRAAGSTATAGASINLINASTATWDYSLAQNIDLTGTGIGNFNGTLAGNDPGFADPPNPALPPGASGDLRLNPASPVIESGDNAANAQPRDLGGRLRIANGDHAAAAVIDLGAYELPRTFHVDDSASGAKNGLTWADAFTKLQDALEPAVAGDEIRVATGAYLPDEGGGQTNNDRDATFTLVSDVTLLGGFPDGGASLPDPAGNPTVLSGDIDVNDVNIDGNNIAETTADIAGNNSHSIVTGLNFSTDRAQVDGFILTAGLANESGSNPKTDGGAFFCDGGRIALTRCSFSGNSASRGGAGANQASKLTVVNSVHSGNAANNGGAFFSQASVAFTTFSGCDFSANASNIFGGALLFNFNARSVLRECTFSGNSAQSGAGIAYSQIASTTVNGCAFSGNNATQGGGIYTGSSPAAATVISDCAFTGNTAINAAGGIYAFNGGFTAANCSFQNNATTVLSLGGGAIACNQSDATVTNCLMSGNNAIGWAGGMSLDDSTATLTSCTVSGNNSDRDGGGLFVSSTSTANLVNTIIWNNRGDFTTETPGASIHTLAGAVVTYSHSLVENFDLSMVGTNNFDGTNLFNGPLFAAPVDPAIAPDAGGSFILTTGSPALDAGDNNANLLAVDLAGSARVQNGTIDLGALEGSVPPLDTDGDGMPDYWELAHITPPSPTKLKPESDGDGDGIVARWEFVHGLNPNIANAGADAFYHTIVNVSGTDYSAIVFRLNSAATPFLSVQTDRSLDLVNWITNDTTLVSISSPWITRRSPVPIPSEVREFLRLKIP